MATFVLVHGAFLGGWAWRRVVSLLRAAGHEVLTPTLTGIGERSHLLGSQVGYGTHVDDIVNVLKYEGLRDVILVGHSYAGLVITGVADREPARIAKLVYLDSQIATSGQNAMGASPSGTADKLGSLAESVGPRMLPPISLDAMGIFDAADRAWVEPLVSPHPMKCLEDVVTLAHGDPRMPRSYIRCTERASMVAFFGIDPLATFVEKAQKEGFQLHEIPSGHHPMITHPQELVSVLQAIATSGTH
jgi:pimeloyl-ACP methyl ester carboxylesterase